MKHLWRYWGYLLLIVLLMSWRSLELGPGRHAGGHPVPPQLLGPAARLLDPAAHLRHGVHPSHRGGHQVDGARSCSPVWPAEEVQVVFSKELVPVAAVGLVDEALADKQPDDVAGPDR